MVTLAYYHLDALFRHRELAEAAARAKQYFSLLEALPARFQSDYLDDLRGRLMLLATHQQWKALSYRQGQISYLDFQERTK